jgi:hypothetical protein
MVRSGPLPISPLSAYPAWFYSSAVMKETWSFEILVNFYQTARRHRLVERWLSRHTFWRRSSRSSAGTPAILIMVFGGFPQFLQANAGIVHRLGRYHFLANSLQLIIYKLFYCSTLYYYWWGGTESLSICATP